MTIRSFGQGSNPTGFVIMFISGEVYLAKMTPEEPLDDEMFINSNS